MKKKVLCVFAAAMMALWMTVQAGVSGLRVEMLTGGELTSSLSKIGKIVLGENDVVLYDKAGAQIGSTPFDQFGKIVFYDDGSQGIDDVAAPSLQVYYDAAEQHLLVRGIGGQQTVRVYSTSGQLLLCTDAINGEATVRIDGLQNGAYLLQAGAQVVKFIKE